MKNMIMLMTLLAMAPFAAAFWPFYSAPTITTTHKPESFTPTDAEYQLAENCYFDQSWNQVDVHTEEEAFCNRLHYNDPNESEAGTYRFYYLTRLYNEMFHAVMRDMINLKDCFMDRPELENTPACRALMSLELVLKPHKTPREEFRLQQLYVIQYRIDCANKQTPIPAECRHKKVVKVDTLVYRPHGKAVESIDIWKVVPIKRARSQSWADNAPVGWLKLVLPVGFCLELAFYIFKTLVYY